MNDDFIGSGWAFPLRTGATGGIALVSGARELEESMRLILSTSPGERPMRPDFGCGIHEHVFDSCDSEIGAVLTTEVRAALERWEPRVAIDEVEVAVDDEVPGLVYIDIRYTPLATNDPRNLVFPFYTIPDGGGDADALPVPNLDDRRFQDLVDDAKRLVQRRCPAWTDHNVSDPGVTLIETFA